jgi:hypothetical protein
MLEWTLDVRPAPEMAVQADATGVANHGGDGNRGDSKDNGNGNGNGNGNSGSSGSRSRTAMSAASTRSRSVASVAAGKNGTGASAHSTAAGTNDTSATTAVTTPQAVETIHPTIIPLTPREPRALQTLLARRLRKWHKQVLAEGEQFVELDIPSRHELRKRAKRLRYGLNFAESLLPAQKMRDYRRRLADVQDVLGEMNDLSVAHDLYRQWSSRHPQAWFALGWISARQEKLVGEAQRTFAKLGEAPAFWK